jgi:hypothetical protein
LETALVQVFPCVSRASSKRLRKQAKLVGYVWVLGFGPLPDCTGSFGQVTLKKDEGLNRRTLIFRRQQFFFGLAVTTVDSAKTSTDRCLLLGKSRRIVLKQLCHRLLEVPVVLFRIFLDIQGLLGRASPDELLLGRVDEVNDQFPDFNG